MYCDRIRKKVINPKPKIKIRNISSSISHIDANDSIGFVAADIGIKKAIDNAKKTGIGLVAVKHHCQWVDLPMSQRDILAFLIGHPF